MPGYRRPPRPRPTARRRCGPFAEQVGYPLILQAAQPGQRPLRTLCVTPTMRPAWSMPWGSSASTAPSRSRWEFIEGHEVLRHHHGRRPGSRCRTTSRTCSTPCGPGGSRRSSSPPTGSTPRRSTPSCAGRRVNAPSGSTSATHMEWFFGPKGLEIGCRRRRGCLGSRSRRMDVYRVGGRDRGRPAAGHRGGTPAGWSRCVPAATARSPATGVEEMQRQYGEWERINDPLNPRLAHSPVGSSSVCCPAGTRICPDDQAIRRRQLTGRPEGAEPRAAQGLRGDAVPALKPACCVLPLSASCGARWRRLSAVRGG